MASNTHDVKVCGEEFGVKVIELTEAQYLNSGDLIDKVVQNHYEICKTGCFIGRFASYVGPSIDEVANQVEEVKLVLKDDLKTEGACEQIFRPQVQIHSNVWPAKGVFCIEGTDEPEGIDYDKARKSFIKNVLKHDFLQGEGNLPTGLELAMMNGGITSCLEAFFQLIRGDQCLMYGANVSMPDNRELPTTLTVKMADIVSHMQHIDLYAGISEPTFYIGSEGTSFNAHIEDFAFESINRLIAGSEKVWFLVPPRFHRAFCSLLNKMGIHKSGGSKCPVMLQHKHFFIDPRTVVRHGIPVYTIRQKPGDIVYVLPYTIHFGFNLGYNVNEAMNLASTSWAKFGMLAEPVCQCFGIDDDLHDMDITPLLHAAGIEENLLSDWKEGRTADLVLETDIRHPERGVPHEENINIQNLLGSNVDPDVKLLTTTYVPMPGDDRLGFWGKTFLVDDDDDDDDDEEEKDNIPVHEELMIDEEDDDDKEEQEESQLQGKTIGPYKCQATACPWKIKQTGTRGLEFLLNHIRNKHEENAVQLSSAARKKYDPAIRTYKTAKTFKCSFCNKTRQGNSAHKRRHEDSCRQKKSEVL